LKINETRLSLIDWVKQRKTGASVFFGKDYFN